VAFGYQSRRDSDWICTLIHLPCRFILRESAMPVRLSPFPYHSC
jgi:hypothetical protein